MAALEERVVVGKVEVAKAALTFITEGFRRTALRINVNEQHGGKDQW